MKTRILLIVMLGLIGLSGRGQTSDSKAKKKNTELLIGIWNIEDISKGKELTNDQKGSYDKLMIEVRQKSFFYFTKDDRFELSFLGEISEGTWRIDNDGKTLLTKESYRSEEPCIIEELNKNKCTITWVEGQSKVAFSLIKGGDSLNSFQKELHEKHLALKKIAEEKYLVDSTYAANAALAMALKAAHEDSIATAMGMPDTAKVQEQLPDCVLLILIAGAFDTDSSALVGELISNDKKERHYRCLFNFNDAKNSYYIFEGTAKKPKKYKAILREDLSKNDANDLMAKKLVDYKSCPITAWKEISKEKDGKRSIALINDNIELSIQMILDKDKKTYSVVLYLNKK